MKTTEPAIPLPTAVYIARRHVNGVEMRLWAFLRGLSIWPLSEEVHAPYIVSRHSSTHSYSWDMQHAHLRD